MEDKEDAPQQPHLKYILEDGWGLTSLNLSACLS